MGGMLAAMRWSPDQAWWFLACDMPLVSIAAFEWLREQQHPGAWVVLPLVAGEPHPLCALYMPPARALLEQALSSRKFSLRKALDHPKVRRVEVPENLAPQWANCNTPEEWRKAIGMSQDSHCDSSASAVKAETGAPLEVWNSWLDGGPPPPIEAEMDGGTVKAWREQGLGADQSPAEACGYLQIHGSGVSFRKTARVVGDIGTEEGARTLIEHYSPSDPKRWDDDWDARHDRLKRQGAIVSLAGWHEGFLQAIGVRDSVSIQSALIGLLEAPKRVERHMEAYSEFVMALLNSALKSMKPSVGIFYEAIASNHAPVISPKLYARHALKPLRRIVEVLRAAGVRTTFVRTAGAVESMIPVWLDAGIDGLYVNQTAAAGVDYLALRKRFGSRLRLYGGLDWRAVPAGGETLRRQLDEVARPLLEQGNAIPYLDDTVRPHIRYDDFRRYRDALNELITP